jgi:2-iminobutanoate/2-iminopropanoate deaminase
MHENRSRKVPNEQRSYAHLNQPRGSYSSAIRNGPWLFIAGTTAGTGKDAPEDLGDIAQQAETVFRNIGGILEAEGGSYANLVTVTVFLTEGGREAYDAVNETRRRLFGDAKPASTMVVVRELARPGHKIEVNATALFR